MVRDRGLPEMIMLFFRGRRKQDYYSNKQQITNGALSWKMCNMSESSPAEDVCANKLRTLSGEMVL